MPYILTNGKNFIWRSETRKIMKSRELEEAEVFQTIDQAKELMQNAQGKTSGYHIVNLETGQHYNPRYNGAAHNRRRSYPAEVRHMVYAAGQGRCYLCGKRIVYDDMTLDHIKPLAMGGRDDVDNLACACEACNAFKGSILPDEFQNRISDIFLYQTEKKQRGKVRWRIARKLLISLAADNG